MSLTQIQEKIHRKLLNFRAFKRFSETRRFEDIWDQSTETEKCEFEEFLKSINFEKWINKKQIKLLGDNTYTELREMAKKSNIPKYSRMDKAQLLSAIWRNNERKDH
jgi:hypothetical protein